MSGKNRQIYTPSEFELARVRKLTRQFDRIVARQDDNAFWALERDPSSGVVWKEDKGDGVDKMGFLYLASATPQSANIGYLTLYRRTEPMYQWGMQAMASAPSLTVQQGEMVYQLPHLEIAARSAYSTSQEMAVAERALRIITTGNIRP